jgi:hypothetical protein
MEKFEIEATLPNGYELYEFRRNNTNRKEENRNSIYGYSIFITQDDCIVTKDGNVVFSCNVVWGSKVKINLQSLTLQKFQEAFFGEEIIDFKK